MKKTIAMILMLCLVQAALCAGAFADGGYRIKAIDPDAFVSQAKIKGVYGEGFDHVKVNLKKEDVDKISGNATNNTKGSNEPTQ